MHYTNNTHIQYYIEQKSRPTGLHDGFSTQHTPLSTSHYAQETQNVISIHILYSV